MALETIPQEMIVQVLTLITNLLKTGLGMITQALGDSIIIKAATGVGLAFLLRKWEGLIPLIATAVLLTILLTLL